MDNPTTKLTLDHWYKVVMAVGLLVALLAGAGYLKEFPTAPTAALGLGAFFFGMGEWINHPLQTTVVPATAHRPAGVMTSHPRSASVAGVLFDALGLGLIGLGVYRLLA